MNFRAIAIVIFLVAVSGGLLVHFRQQSITEGSPALVKIEGIPQPPISGPYGKFVVVGESEYDFGVMEHGQKGSHEFKIRNDGPGPLKMVARKEDHTCQCTLGSLGADGLKPGEETTVTLSWEIKNPALHFHHSAKIRTDDPDNPTTTFHVKGLVGKRLTVAGGNDVNVGTLSENVPTERTIVVHSETVDAFEITKIESSIPMIVTTSSPMTLEQLKAASVDPSDAVKQQMQEQMKMVKSIEQKESKHADDHHDSADEFLTKKLEPKSGHEIKIAFQPGFPIGRFRESITIHTDIPNTSPIIVLFQGNRSGPIQILGTPGVSWSPEESLLRLGRFRAEDGKKARLLVFIKKTEDPWKIISATVEPPFVTYQLVKDENFKGAGRDRYDLMLEIPPGSAPLSLTGDKVGSLTFETNHPEAKVIKFDLDYNSY